MKLFLDDVRFPNHCTSYMSKRVGEDALTYAEGGWHIVRNYDEFREYLESNPMPELISFDHDLHPEHYSTAVGIEAYLRETKNYKEKTGLDCAIFLMVLCNSKNLEKPKCLIHSMNSVGHYRIATALGIKAIFDY